MVVFLAGQIAVWHDVGTMAIIKNVKVFVDGGCKGNPGFGAVGVVILGDDGKILAKHAECIGHSTCNEAEYRAVIFGLAKCAGQTRESVTVFSDSELIVKQLAGIWRIRQPRLVALYQKVMDAQRLFKGQVVYTKVNRGHKYIRMADRLLKGAFEGETVTTVPF